MCAIVCAVVAAVVVAAGAAASAVVSKNAADHAAKAQKKGVEQQNQLLNKNMNPDKLNDLAERFDKDRARNRIEFQKEIDPELAALRQKGKEQLLEQANANPETRQSGLVAKELFNEVKEQDPRMQALKNSLIQRAQEDLDAGATLPPTFQAELVRAGLNTGSQAGVAIDKSTIGGGVARVLGAAGLQLQAQRTQEANQLAHSAQDITNARVNILATVFPKLRDLESVNRQDALVNFQVGDNTLPEVGLTGREAVNIQIAKTKAKGALLQKSADIKAQQAKDQGVYTSQLIGAGTSLVSGVLGAYSGGAGGGNGTGSAIISANSRGGNSPYVQGNTSQGYPTDAGGS